MANKDLTGEQYGQLMQAFVLKDYDKIFKVLLSMASDNFNNSKIQSIANMTPAQLTHRLQSLSAAQDAALSTILHLLEGRKL